MLSSSRLAIIFILLTASSCTPLVPRDDGARADLAEELMEPVENLMAPAVPRQVYTGHHGPADGHAPVTKALPAPTANNMYAVDNEKYGAAQHYQGHAGVARQESSSINVCPLLTQTVRVTVETTVTVVANVETLLPRPILPRQPYTGDYDDEAPPIPTADLLLNNLEARDDDREMAMAEGMVKRDEPQGDYRLPDNPGGGVVKALPPLVPALETIASTLLSPFAPALSTVLPSVTGLTSAATPIPIVPIIPPFPLIPLSGQGCTTTILGNFAKPCRAAGAVTVYTSTVTSYSPVDCGVCTSVRVIQPKWGCPFMSVANEVTADSPFTSTAFLCSGAAAAAAAATGAAGLAPPALVTPALGSLVSLVSQAPLVLATPALQSLVSLVSLAPSALPTPALESLVSLVIPALESLVNPAVPALESLVNPVIPALESLVNPAVPALESLVNPVIPALESLLSLAPARPTGIATGSASSVVATVTV